MLHYTEEELRSLGFEEHSPGCWGPKRTTPRACYCNPHSRTKHQSSVSSKTQESDASKKADEGSSKTSNQRVFEIEVVVTSRRHIDPDNILPKWFIDEAVKAGLLEDDNSKWVLSITKRVVKVEKNSSEGTVLIIREYQLTNQTEKESKPLLIP